MLGILSHQGNDVKTTLRLHITLVQMTVTKKKNGYRKMARVWGKGGPLDTAGGMETVQPLWKSVQDFSKK